MIRAAGIVIWGIIMGSAPALADICSGIELAGLRACTDAKATQLAGGPAWLACHGDCLIRQDGPDAQILDNQGKLREMLVGHSFLPGTGNTACLGRLAFLTDEGRIRILDAEALSQRASAPLEVLFDENPGDAALRDRLLSRARLSCDGQRFYAPLSDSDGFLLARVADETLHPDDSIGALIVLSPSGRYALGVDDASNGRFRLRDLQEGRDFLTSATFEIDIPGFDLAERALLIRRAYDAPVIEVYDLQGGSPLGEVAVPPESGPEFQLQMAAGKPQLTPLEMPPITLQPIE